MIDALITGKLVRDPSYRIAPSGKSYTDFLMAVPVGEENSSIISGIAFGETSQRIAKLKRGDPDTISRKWCSLQLTGCRASQALAISRMKFNRRLAIGSKKRYDKSGVGDSDNSLPRFDFITEGW